MAKVRAGPITGWRPGERVRVVRAYYDMAKGPIAVGTVGTLSRLYRVQDGIECWGMWVPFPPPTRGLYYVGLGHVNVERLTPATDSSNADTPRREETDAGTADTRASEAPRAQGAPDGREPPTTPRKT